MHVLKNSSTASTKEVIEYLAVHKLVQDNNIMIDKAPQWNRYVFHIIEEKIGFETIMGRVILP
jgi:hypothetical protein